MFENVFRDSASFAGDKSTVEVELFRDSNNFVIDIADNDSGVDPMIQDLLFQKGALTTSPQRGL